MTSIASLHTIAAGVGTSPTRTLTSGLRGRRRPVAPVGIIGGAPGPTRNRALPHQGKTDLSAGGPHTLPPLPQRRQFHPARVATPAGRQLAMTFRPSSQKSTRIAPFSARGGG